MQVKNHNSLSPVQPLKWLAVRVIAGAGACPFLLSQPSFAQPAELLLSQSNNPNPAAGEIVFYEMKKDDLYICKKKPKKDESDEEEKKECTQIGQGYASVLSKATELYIEGSQSNGRALLESAESLLRQGLQRYPNDAITHYKLGNALYAQGKLDEAVAEFRQAININSKYALAHNALGLALAKQGQMEEAVAQLRQAIEINSKYAEARRNLGLALLDRGQQEEGIDNLKKAVELFKAEGKTPEASRIEQFLQQRGLQ
ncbi:tetratricopeptide repeat protein [Kamptonema formosum]|uniref:tetratricopeptide repeat protein n=1 Tax=Kamptonema formosum TaxID=331992 RepID=UPI00034D7E92|nr:tetratricopeptide repeat protein [Oscillatoria sp. PCC 10802]